MLLQKLMPIITTISSVVKSTIEEATSVTGTGPDRSIRVRVRLDKLSAIVRVWLISEKENEVWGLPCYAAASRTSCWSRVTFQFGSS